MGHGGGHGLPVGRTAAVTDAFYAGCSSVHYSAQLAFSRRAKRKHRLQRQVASRRPIHRRTPTDAAGSGGGGVDAVAGAGGGGESGAAAERRGDASAGAGADGGGAPDGSGR